MDSAKWRLEFLKIEAECIKIFDIYCEIVNSFTHRIARWIIECIENHWRK